MVATPRGFFPSEIGLRPQFPDEKQEICEIWPGPVPFSRSAGRLPAVIFPKGWYGGAASADDVTRKKAIHARFAQEAMRVLLGSVRARTTKNEPPLGTWTSVAASLFGASFGGGPASKATAAEAPKTAALGAQAAEWGAANGWLASELLVRRATEDGEPLVLTAKLQEQLADMDEALRSQFLSELKLGYEDGEAKAVSAYAVIVQVFRLVQDLTERGVTTILDLGKVFSGKEIAQAIKRLASSAQWSNAGVQKLMDAADAAKRDPSAETRRCGPRFLLRCLLLLEKKCSGVHGKRSAAEDRAAVEVLKKKMPKTLNTSLLGDLALSKLNIWRGGQTEIDFIIPSNVAKFDGDFGGLYMSSFLEFIGDYVATELAPGSFQEGPTV